MSQQVKTRAHSISKLLGNALDWVSNSEDSGIANNYLLKKDLKRSIAQCKRLETAAGARMCVGVYGASQAGKSYLVSVLATRNERPLMARFGNDQVDFLRQINPAGGQESTGLVTRFTTDQHQTPTGFPVQARLLTEMDLAKIFVNSFAEDVLTSEDEDYEALAKQSNTVLESLEKEPPATSPVRLEEVYELEDYCNTRLGMHPNAIVLKKIDFWERAAELLPRLDLQDRIRLVELIWEGLPPITELYSQLVFELFRIGNPTTVYCPIEALMQKKAESFERSEHSIINVSTLEGLVEQDGVRIEVSNEQGTTASIAVSVLCALIAELLIPLSDQPHEFFEHTDLLDFPGARSRNPRPKVLSILSQGQVKVESFLRGKVAYLFDKFSSDLQLNSMLLCVGPSNLEVSGLPRLVEEWVALTHGQSPDERAKLPTSLFLILTKFDRELGQDSGKQSDGSRWSTRLEASLIKPFGAHSHRTSWVNAWHPDTPFSNTYWLRNPKVDQFGLVEYEGEIASSREIGFAKERSAYLNNLKNEFLQNSLVKQHFQHPAQAWEAAMSLNDGGVTYIVAALSRVCQPANKLSQIDERLSSLLLQRYGDLKKYYVTSDRDEITQEKTELAHALLKFGAVLIKKQRLGEFIGFLLIDDAETREIFQRIQLHYERERSALKAPLTEDQAKHGDFPAIDDDLAEMLGIEAERADEADAPEGLQIESGDNFPDRFVVNFLSEWESAILSKAMATNLGGYLHLDIPLLQKLLHEIERAAYRTGLVNYLKDVTRQSYQYRSSTTKSWILKQTSILTSIFNEFVAHGALSLSQTSYQQVVKTFDGRELEIFKTHHEPQGEIEVPETSSERGKQYLLDWLHALQSSVRQNGEYVAVQQGNTEANRQLGDILRALTEHHTGGEA